MDGHWQPDDSHPDLEDEVDNESLQEELVGTTVHEMEEPLLSGIGSVMPDVTSCVGRLVVEILLSVPSSVLHLRHSESLTVAESHVLNVTVFIMG